jgi:hypothetical protein
MQAGESGVAGGARWLDAVDVGASHVAVPSVDEARQEPRAGRRRFATLPRSAGCTEALPSLRGLQAGAAAGAMNGAPGGKQPIGNSAVSPRRRQAAAVRNASTKAAYVRWKTCRAWGVEAWTRGAGLLSEDWGRLWGCSARIRFTPTQVVPESMRSARVSASTDATKSAHAVRYRDCDRSFQQGKGDSSISYCLANWPGATRSPRRRALYCLLRSYHVPRSTCPLVSARTQDAPGHSTGRSTSPSWHPFCNM